ncbi:hypothetical protein X742_24470 [Mesorhizobium sp. LNHC232B00]|nr:hypothetical protein X742_24470 [Mesorhizobium sp. LNHC232B00]
MASAGVTSKAAAINGNASLRNREKLSVAIASKRRRHAEVAWKALSPDHNR